MKKTKTSKSRKNKKDALLILGADGRMGQELLKLLPISEEFQAGALVGRQTIRALEDDYQALFKTNLQTLTAVLEASDYVLDFSSPAGTSLLIRSLTKTQQKTVLIGTTGLSPKLLSALKQVAKSGKHRILWAGNTSLGIMTLSKTLSHITKPLTENGFDVEITETHHRRKVDAPSGTALLLAKVILSESPKLRVDTGRKGKRSPNSLGIHSVRAGGVVGEHEVRFISDYEEVCLSHRALNRSVFAAGALSLLRQISQKLKYGQCVDLLSFLQNEA